MIAFTVNQLSIYFLSELEIGHNPDDILFDPDCTLELSECKKLSVEKT